METSPQPLLTVENLEKRFISHVLGGKPIIGFRKISFTVPHGTAMGLSGPSGHGKSSVLKCIYRTYGASSGQILYDSKAFGPVQLTDLPENQVLALRRDEIGYVTQFFSVLPRVSTRDVVAEPLVNAGISKADARERSGALLQRLRIDPELHDAYPATFSGGEKQRVNLARAIIHPPRLLLLDEPTASLDVDALSIVLQLLSELKNRGTTMLAIFHDKSIMDRLMDTTFTMPEKET